MANKRYFWIATVALLLALVVIMLGAYTRLSDAGLGCPDWPGCYGKLVLPQNAHGLAQAQQAFPAQPIVPGKAWKEMIHRYFAGSLGIIILGLCFWAFARKKQHLEQSIGAPVLLLAVLGFQVILGMWTVTLKVLPLVVMGHLMGGMAIASLLCWLALSVKNTQTLGLNRFSSLKPWVFIGLCIVVFQIFLGAWTSTNYAALACPHFPTCHGSLFPALDLKNAFNFAAPIGPNYEGGLLDMPARVTIQMVHRYGALLTVLFWLPFSLYLMAKFASTAVGKLGLFILLLLVAQVLLGILNVVKLLPMAIAVGHNGIAAVLLVTVVALTHTVYKR